jgi:CubicO group peptidase (beta-lactamase class C family)
VDALRTIDGWGARTAAAGVTRAEVELAVHGPRDSTFRWASVTKLLTGLAVLVAVEEGIVDLDDAAGPEGSTLRHLLAHASGLPPDEGPPLMPPERRRIYSNYGIELAAERVAERAQMPFAEYFSSAVVEPLTLAGELRGSPAWGYRGPLDIC